MSKQRSLIALCIIVIIGSGAYLVINKISNSASHSSVNNSPPSSILPPQDSGNAGEPVTLEGEMVCLPHRNTEGPQTLECAFGLKDASGTYFALQDTSSDYSLVSKVANGDMVRVTGTKYSQPSDKYQTETVIKITSLEKVN